MLSCGKVIGKYTVKVKTPSVVAVRGKRRPLIAVIGLDSSVGTGRRYIPGGRPFRIAYSL
jgi:hypothetical protein